ncbi:Protein-lysine N-methyltransferase efm5 [Lecanora helva]
MDEANHYHDEPLQLPDDTLAALQEFYTDRDLKEKRFHALKSQVEQAGCHEPWSMDMFSENWNASQFWYSDDTATLLAELILDGATRKRVLTRSKQLNKGLPETSGVTLLEFDDRFNIFQEFVHYNFERPLDLPSKLATFNDVILSRITKKIEDGLKGKFDRVVCDPPFLSPDCQSKGLLCVKMSNAYARR